MNYTPLKVVSRLKIDFRGKLQKLLSGCKNILVCQGLCRLLAYGGLRS